MRVQLSRIFLVLLLIVSSTISFADTWLGQCQVKFKGDPEQWKSLATLQSTNPQVASLLRDWKVSRTEQMIPFAEAPHYPTDVEMRTWWKFFVPLTTDIDAMVAEFKKLDVVLYAEPVPINRTYELDLNYNDPKFTSGRGQWALRRVHSQQAHDFCTGNSTIIVAIVDTGIDFNHPDISPNIYTDSLGHHGHNFEVNTATPDSNSPMPVTGGEHGTHCAGLASARTNNGVGVASLGYRCKVMGVRCGIANTIDYGEAGIVWAANHGADVISCSWGGTSGGQSEIDAIHYAWVRNCVICLAAGNDYNSVLHYPACYGHYPTTGNAALGEPISVAASDSTDHKSSFSCYGDWIDVTSPGSSIISTVPSSTPGAGPYTNAYATWDGTSMATPIAAGLAALIKSRIGHTATNADIRGYMLDCCVPIDTNTYRNQLGHGRIDALRAMQLFNTPVIQYLGQQMTFTSGATRLLPGGTANLAFYLNVLASFSSVDSGYIHVICNDPSISFDNTYVQLGHINAGTSWDNEASPIHVTAASSMTPHLVSFRVQLHAQPSNYDVEYDFPYFVGWQEVLLVDASAGDSSETYYDRALTTLNVSHEIYSLENSGSINDGYMNNFTWVIWETGNDVSTMDPYHQNQINNYLANGGKMFVSSQYMTRDALARQLLLNTIHADSLHRYDLTTSISTITPVASDPIGLAGLFYIIGGTGFGNGRVAPSTVVPDSSCTVCYRLGSTNEACGVYHRVGNGEIVFFSVAAEAISPATGAGALSDLLGRIRTQFQSLTNAPESPSNELVPVSFAVGQAYPNPFNSTTSLSLAIPTAQNVTLTVFDQLGRERMHEVYRNLTAGNHTVSITLPGASSGVYFAQVNTTTGITITRKLVYLR